MIYVILVWYWLLLTVYCFLVGSCKSNKQLLFMYKTTGPSYMTKGRHQFLDSIYKLTACFWDKLQSVKMFYNDHNGYLQSPCFFLQLRVSYVVTWTIQWILLYFMFATQFMFHW